MQISLWKQFKMQFFLENMIHLANRKGQENKQVIFMMKMMKALGLIFPHMYMNSSSKSKTNQSARKYLFCLT